MITNTLPAGLARSRHLRGRPRRTEGASVARRSEPGYAVGAYARTRGMTLIEILVVLVLIGVVMGIVGGNFIQRGEKAKRDAARIEIGQIGQTLDLFKLEVGRYPTSQEGLRRSSPSRPG